jgi:hypothetical protein
LKIIIFENQHVICELDDSLPVLKYRWKPTLPGPVFRENLMTIGDCYRSLSRFCKNLTWLADTRQMGEADEETEKWFTEVWESVLFNEPGVKLHAVILSDDFFSEYPMEKFKLHAMKQFRTHGVQLEVFSDKRGGLRLDSQRYLCKIIS